MKERKERKLCFLYLFFDFMDSTSTMTEHEGQEIADIMLVASEKESYASKKMATLAALLEGRLLPLTKNSSLRSTEVEGLTDIPVQNNLRLYDEELYEANPSPLQVDGDGNCLDNATLFEVFGDYSQAFSFRVRKGLHFVRNLEAYRAVLKGCAASDLQDERDLCTLRTRTLSTGNGRPLFMTLQQPRF